ncbi:MAG: chemotaxis protein CheA [Candidatus Methanofastidiosa archaeon]|nr:chemotaxis protein CheA [Candidatus Methanofastidiosa archaeon]
MDQFQSKFLEEATDILNELEDSLFKLEEKPSDKEMIERVFRAMHTLKGGGAMFGFTNVSEFTHNLETLFDLVRNGKQKVNKELIDIAFEAVDHIKALLNLNEENNSDSLQKADKLTQSILKYINQKGNESITEESNQKNNKDNAGEIIKTYYIYFDPNSDIFDNGTNPLYLIDDLYAIGKCKVCAVWGKLPEYADYNPEKCYLSWHIFIATAQSEESLKDVFIFVEDKSKVAINELSNDNLLSNNDFLKYIDETYSSSGNFSIDKMTSFIKGLKNENSLKDKVKSTISGVSVQNTPQQKDLDTTLKNTGISSIRVDSNKLDDLMSVVSELVTTQARLSLYAENNTQPELVTIAEEFEKITRRLRDNVFSVRLVPLSSIITRFQRLVRELSKETGKDVEFITEGTDTELDKNMIECLVDPIMHVIRNSIDHGIEDAAERKKQGKPIKGKIVLKAFYSGTNVFIQVIDDGKGIDEDAITKKAIEKGIITADAKLTKREMLDLIFIAGFSTAKSVTNISGRGVGMDVVKKKISDLRCEVEVLSEINKGTTISMKLPLTLSIIDGLLVCIEKTHYVIPLASIDKCYAFEHNKLMNAVNNLIYAGEEHIPFVYLRKIFGFIEEAPQNEQVIVVEYNANKIGLAVDKVVGEYQAVLKSLGKIFKKQDIISGATILGDGTVALVLDTNKIIYQYSTCKNN